MAIKASNSLTIVDITDSYSVNLESEAYCFSGDKNGSVSNAVCTTTVHAKRGSSDTAITIGTITFTNNGANLTEGISATVTDITGTTKKLITFAITNSIQILPPCEATIPITIGSGPDAVQFEKKFSFSVAKIGADGAPGSDGENGADGTSTYVYIRYSANSDGTNFRGTPDSTTKYMGVAVTTSDTAPTEKTAYSWQKYVGDDAIDLTISPSGSTVFRNSTGSVTLTANVTVGGGSVACTYSGSSNSQVNYNGVSLGVLKWYKSGQSSPLSTSRTYTVSASQVTNSQLYYCQLEG